jgi:hypothetical protein
MSMARPAEHFEIDPVIVLIEDDEPTMTFEEWLDLVAADEPVDLGTSAAALLHEARETGEV